MVALAGAVALTGLGFDLPAHATPFTETIPDGRGSQIPDTYPPVGGTVVVLEGANGNYYYQFVNPSTQFQGRNFSGQPANFRGNPFQLGPTQTLDCGVLGCNTFFGGSVVRAYIRLTARDGDACPGNFDNNDLEFRLNGFTVGSFSNVQAERTNLAGTTSRGFENCFRNQRSTETSTGWFTSTDPALLGDILANGTTPQVFDRDPNDNVWFFRDGQDASGSPRVAPGLTIEKLADKSTYSTLNEPIEYTFNLQNVGSVQLNNIVVADAQIPGTVTCDATSLAPAARTTCRASYLVTQKNIDDGTFPNIATATATPTEGTLGPVRGELTLTGPAAAPAATLTKDATPEGPVAAGETITYSYVVTNTGNVTLRDASVTDVHSGSGTLSAITPAPVDLAPLASQTFTATYEVTQADFDAQTPITNTATLSSTPARGGAPNVTANESVAVTGATATLELAKAATTTSFDGPDQTINYEFTVTNTGSITLVAPITVNDSRIGAITCPVSAAGVAPGTTLSCPASDTTTQADVNAGSITNTATVSANGVTSAQVSETVNATQSPALTVAKSLSAGGPDFDAVGDLLTYAYLVTNTGNTTLNAITIADDRVNAAGDSVVCPAVPAGGLPPGQTLTCSATYSVTQNDLNAGSVTNTATATGDGTASPPSSVTVQADQNPALTTTKTAQQTLPSQFVVGGTVDYVYLIENTGNTTLTSAVTVADDRIPSVACDALPTGGLLPGGQLECRGSYTLTSQDIAFGSVTNIASATSGTVTSPQTSETIPNTATPDLSIAKTARNTDFAGVGDILTYDFTVTNTGDATLVSDVTIADDRIRENPLTCFSPSATDPDFRSGETASCVGTYVITQADLDAGQVVNEASANAVSAGAPVSSAPATSTVQADRNPAFTIAKTSTATSFSAVGDVIPYTFTITNTGNQTLSAIGVSDPLIPTLSCSTATLAPTDPALVCTASYTVTQADIDTGRVPNSATATARDGENNTLSETGTLSVPGPAANPTMTLGKSSTSTVARAGEVATFDFLLTNTGNVSISTVAVADPLCDVAPRFTGGDSAPLGTLDVGEAWTYTCDVTATQAQVNAGEIANAATATGTPARGTLSPAPGNATVNIAPNVAVTFEKVLDSALPDPLVEGSELTYRFRVVNDGNVTLDNITVTDAGAVVTGGPISLAPGAEDTTTFRATQPITQAELDAGEISNQANVSVTPPGGPATQIASDDPSTTAAPGDATVTVLPRSPRLELIKTATVNSTDPAAARAGDTVSYTFTVRNTGNVSISNISVTDPGVTGLSTGTIALAPGGEDTTTFTGTYVLTQPDIDAGEYINSATASGVPAGGGTVSDLSDSPRLQDGAGPDDPTIAVLGADPKLDLTKTGVFDNGAGTITYSFRVTNTGNVTIVNTVVRDPLISTDPLGPAIATLAPGAFVDLDPVVYTLTQADRDRGFVENSARAEGIDRDPVSGEPVVDRSDDPSNPDGEDDPTRTLITQSPGIAVVKTGVVDVGANGRADEGETITYTFTVTNTGDVTLSDIGITDAKVDVAATIATLAPGDPPAVLTGTYVLTQADIDLGTVQNTATAAGEAPNGDSVSDVSGSDNGNDDPTVTPIVPASSIALVKRALPFTRTPVQPGDIISYALEVTNTGNVTLDAVSVVDAGATVTGTIATLAPGATDTTTIEATHVLTPAEINSGSFTNSATATGTLPDGTTTVSDVSGSDNGNDDPTVTALPASAGIEVTKTADASGLSTPPTVDDVIRYTFTVRNTGNVTLTGVTITDDDAVVSGAAISLAAGVENATAFTALRRLTQGDIDAGTFANQATASGLPPSGPAISDLSDDPSTLAPDDPTVTLLPQQGGATLEKTLVSTAQVFPYTFDLTYRLQLTNTGNVTAVGTTLADDLAAALAPARLVSASVTSVTGASANPAFDGATDTGTIQPVALAPGADVIVELVARMDTTGGTPTGGNTAIASSAAFGGPVPSDDPTRTPGDPADTNPTLVPLEDTDADGAPDNLESATADRDGDGIPDAQDYDPTGYFYCQEDGRILPGGRIRVTGPLGTQSGVGTSANINILRDGSDGRFQFFVTAPGRYTLAYDLPATGAASTDRLPGAPLDLSAFLPTNPVVLGSGEVGATGQLAAFDAAANPFSTVFDVEAGDPSIFNVNVPLQFCTVPQLTAGKRLSAPAVTLADGSTRLTYELSIANEGVTPVRSVALTDDLAAVFGAGRATVADVSIVNSGGASLTLNAGYDGQAVTGLLAPGQSLDPGARSLVTLVVDVNVATSGTFDNSVTASGASPLDGSAVTPSSASASVTLTAAADLAPLRATKATNAPSARVGDVVSWTITMENTTALDRSGLRIVDLMPAGFTYRPGSALIDGVATEPVQSGRRLVFDGLTIAAGDTLTLTLSLGVGAGAKGDEFVNSAFAEDPATGRRLSNVATAAIRREIEPVFDCGEIIGKVFDDRNRNGYQDKGEAGLPGVRVVTVRGLLITTDRYGRFSVACADVPDEDIGSNFIMKLDKRTLPTGYRLTTENPRVVRLTRGKLTKLNFGATLVEAVSIDLDARAFAGTTARPGRALDRGLDQLVSSLIDRKSPALTIRYRDDGRRALSRARVKSIAGILRDRWKRSGGRGRPDIETRIINGKGR